MLPILHAHYSGKTRSEFVLRLICHMMSTVWSILPDISRVRMFFTLAGRPDSPGSVILPPGSVSFIKFG